jgi:hypothetical protein
MPLTNTSSKLINTRCFTQDFTGQRALETERQTLAVSERAAREHAEQLNRAKDPNSVRGCFGIASATRRSSDPLRLFSSFCGLALLLARTYEPP